MSVEQSSVMIKWKFRYVWEDRLSRHEVTNRAWLKQTAITVTNGWLAVLPLSAFSFIGRGTGQMSLVEETSDALYNPGNLMIAKVRADWEAHDFLVNLLANGKRSFTEVKIRVGKL